MDKKEIKNNKKTKEFQIDFNKIPDLSTQEVLGKIIGKSNSWFERHRWAGTGIEFIKIGRTPMYSKQAVLDYFKVRTVGTNQDMERGALNGK